MGPGAAPATGPAGSWVVRGSLMSDSPSLPSGARPGRVETKPDCFRGSNDSGAVLARQLPEGEPLGPGETRGGAPSPHRAALGERGGQAHAVVHAPRVR